MARSQYVPDVGQQGYQFSYNTELLTGDASFGNLTGNFSGQTILNSNESAFLDGFFENPENMDGNMLGLNESSDHKVNPNTLSGGALGGFEQISGTIDNPTSTLGATPNAGYETHTEQNHVPISDHMSEFFNNHIGQEPSDEYRTATTLFRMSNGHGQTQPPAYNTLAATSWGAFGMQSPFNSSGQQSTNSFPASNHRALNSLPNYQTFQSALAQQQTMQHWLPQYGGSHARLNPLHIDTDSAYDFFPQATAQMRMSQSAHPYSQSYRPQPPMRFGSDRDFGHHRYHAPNNYVPQDHEKAANLNNVPLAAQAAAATGQPSFPGMTPLRMHARHSLPSVPPIFHSTSSSPSHMAGLPHTNPMSAIHQPQQNMKPMAHRTIEAYDNDDEDDEVEVDEPTSRKRRRSQMESDEDAEYSPSEHVKGSKRGPKGATAIDGSDDDDDTYSPSGNNISVKRRKSTLTGRASLDSSSAASPSAMSPSARPTTAGGRKKHRHSQPRQNLSGEQKRQNHIASEKHRRDLIKGNYSELDDLVPALNRGTTTLSRADQLSEIVSFVESIAAGNANMARRLGISGTAATTGASIAAFG